MVDGARGLVHSPYAWFRDFTTDFPLIRDWLARCMARPAWLRVLEADAKLMSGSAT
jgi:glutathione S-transferase